MSNAALPAATAISPDSGTQGAALRRWQRKLLNVFAILLLAMMGLIALQVLCGLWGVNALVRFDPPVVLLGSSLNQNTILDLQWFLLAIVGLVPAALVWQMDRHVRVDFIWQTLPPHQQRRIELTGHLLFTAPFLFMSVPAAWRFVQRSFASNEATSHGGLTHLFLVKATLPIGLGLLALVLMLDIWRLLRGGLSAPGDRR